MRYVQCGGLEKPWSVITLGCWQIAPSGGWGDVCTPETADRVVKSAWDAGITAFDTAEGYGDNESERRLGHALGSHKYDAIVISKIWPDAELDLDSYQERLDGTLKALDRDYVDVYLIHWPGNFFNSREKSDKVSELMFHLKACGKAKVIGLSNFRADDLAFMGEGLPRYEINEVPYNLLEREYEGKTRELCQNAGLGYMAYSPTAVGFLAKEMNSGDLKYPARTGECYFHEPYLQHSKKVFQIVQEIAEELGATPIQVALGWVLGQENILTAIAGTRKPEQISDLQKAGDLQLSAEHLNHLTQASDDYHQALSKL